MAALNFRGKLLLIFTSLLGLTLGATSYFVVTGTYASIENNAEQELDVAVAVFEQLMDEHRTRLHESNLILTTDFALKDAIATNEDETILSVLVNHGDRINADMVVLLDPQGETVFATHDNIFDATDLSSLLAEEDQGASIMTLAEGEPYQLVLAPVRAPEDIIAWVGMGFAINAKLAANLKQITTTDITLVYQDTYSPAPRRLTTLDISSFADTAALRNPNSPDFAAAGFDSLDRYVEVINRELAENEHLTTTRTLIDNDQEKLVAILSTSLQQELLPYQNLRLQILTTFIVALVIAIAVTYFVARSVTQPIESLVVAAKRIAKGNYRQAIRVPSKNELGLLGQTLNIMQGAINQREEHIIYQSRHDLLTQLPNRDYIRDEIKTRLNRDLSGVYHALCILQVSNLNQLSDVYGTDVKDQLLVLIAERLRGCTGDYDLVARIASNEFLIFFNDFDRHRAGEICQQIFNTMDGTYRCGSIDVRATTKIGLVYCPEHGTGFDELLRRAYIALSHCQRSTHRYAVYQVGEDTSHLRKINITSRLQHAIRHDGFTLVFHPQFDIRSQTVKQCEVLVRWQDEELGQVSPAEFIPLAEHSGDIIHITHWVFDRCIQQMQTWRDSDMCVGLCINLSARDILSEEFVNYVLQQIDAAGIDKHLIVLEITETAMIEDPRKAIDNLRTLYDAGIHLAMDDFGTGFSSLNQLKSIPIHELKIDKSFIENIDVDINDQKIVKATIEMAHNLNLIVVAEGVETKAAFDFLQSIHCDIIQGYYLTKPLARKELESWLRADEFRPLFAAS